MIDQEIRRGKICKGAGLRYTPNGKPVYEFTIGQYAHKKNEQDEWELSKSRFIRCVAWPGREGTPTQNLPEIAGNELGEGAFVVVVGKEVTRQWEDNDGTKRSAQEFRVDNIYLDITQLTPDGHPQQGAPGGDGQPPF